MLTRDVPRAVDAFNSLARNIRLHYERYHFFSFFFFKRHLLGGDFPFLIDSESRTRLALLSITTEDSPHAVVFAQNAAEDRAESALPREIVYRV